MDDELFRALQEQSHHLLELTKHPGWEVFVDYLRFAPDGGAVRQNQLVNGGAKDFNDYSLRVGWLKGVQYAIDAPSSVQQKVLAEVARRDERRLAE